MSDIIKLLPESIANQIAAGEVVPAPSYVVKELLENAIDAGATEIRVEVIDDGKTCIHVLDNGKGMSPTDARMAFERHATSKISTSDDLHRLTTMGFRGEALAAICAVSQVELQTRQASDELGTSLQLSGSQIVKVEQCVMAPGTSIKVKDLYFNTPARRRFLRANRDYNDIVKEFDRVALVYPQVAMYLYKDGKLVKELSKSQLKQRILSAVTTTNKKSTQLEKDLLRIHYDSPIIRISGYVGQPEGATKTKSQQFFFVNHRYMDHPYFSKAVALAFENFIPDGAKPNFFIYFEVAPEDIDVNVHPAKTEIRFANQEAIFPLLRNLVREAITSSKSYAQISFEAPTVDIPSYTGRKEEVHAPCAPKMIRRVLSSPSDPLARAHAGLNTERFRSLSSISSDSIDWDTFATPSAPEETEKPSLFGDMPLSSQSSSAQPRRHLGTNTQNSLGIIHYNGRYIVSPLRGNLAIIDYQRARYRLLYDEFVREFDPAVLEIEQRLYNEIIPFSEGERELVVQAMNELRAIGFEYSLEADDGQLTLLSSPKLMGDRVAELLQEILHKSMETHQPIIELARDSLAELYAKSKAVGQIPSSEEEITLLLGELFSCSEPNFTPDGRRIIFVISERDVDNYFA